MLEPGEEGLVQRSVRGRLAPQLMRSNLVAVDRGAGLVELVEPEPKRRDPRLGDPDLVFELVDDVGFRLAHAQSHSGPATDAPPVLHG